jgi:hypothetical protein
VGVVVGEGGGVLVGVIVGVLVGVLVGVDVGVGVGSATVVCPLPLAVPISCVTFEVPVTRHSWLVMIGPPGTASCVGKASTVTENWMMQPSPGVFCGFRTTVMSGVKRSSPVPASSNEMVKVRPTQAVAVAGAPFGPGGAIPAPMPATMNTLGSR